MNSVGLAQARPNYLTFSTLIVKPHTYFLITGLQAGAIAGIVIGIVVVVALVLIGTFLLSFYIYKKSKSVGYLD